MVPTRDTARQSARGKGQGGRGKGGKGGAAGPAEAAGRKAGKEGAGRARHLAAISDSAARLSTALDALEKARTALEDSFQRAAARNLSRAQAALGTLRRLAEAGPILDARRLERELSVLVDEAGDLADRNARGRKRDLLAVDRYLGDAAARLELAATPATGAHLELLSERLAGLESARHKHQAAIQGRFRSRLGNARKVLGSLPAACAGLDGRALERVFRELEPAVKLCRAVRVEKLQGRSGDLYDIDGLAKRLERRLSRVRAAIDPPKAGAGR